MSHVELLPVFYSKHCSEFILEIVTAVFAEAEKFTSEGQT
jgi:hypothetical protein